MSSEENGTMEGWTLQIDYRLYCTVKSQNLKSALQEGAVKLLRKLLFQPHFNDVTYNSSRKVVLELNDYLLKLSKMAARTLPSTAEMEHSGIPLHMHGIFDHSAFTCPQACT